MERKPSDAKNYGDLLLSGCKCSPLPLPLPILLDPYRGQYDNSTRKNSGKDEFYGRTLKIFKGLIEYVFE